MKTLSERAKEVLNKRELGYFQMINGQYLVMMLKGKPGTWKSAILKSIADKLDMVFIDLRLPTMDEVDLGAFPVIAQDKIGDNVFVPVIKMGIPEWAMATLDKKKNFMIVFEELNRTSTAVRNAALGLLLERRIGPNFTFGDNVYMAATGNLGMDDGTEVEEFDTALKSRLIPVHHAGELTEWLEFAETVRDAEGKITKKGSIHEDIVNFIKSDPTAFYPELKEQGGKDNTQGDVITNPRTWTALSHAIVRNFGEDAKSSEYRQFVQDHGSSYIGARAIKFLRYLDENVTVTLQDVLDGKVKDMSKIKRDNKAEIMRSFEVFDPNTLKKTKKGDESFARLCDFLKSCDRDLFVGGLNQFGMNRIVALGGKPGGEREREMMQIFKKEYDYIIEQETTENEKTNKSQAK